MHDHIYRMCVAWQNVGYNQPPHLGYYLPGKFNKKPIITPMGTLPQKSEVKEGDDGNKDNDVDDPKR